VRCLKSLYLDRNHDELRDPLDVSAQRVLREGRAVGELAQELFPGGALARVGAPFDFAGALARTQVYIEAGEAVIYEAAIEHGGVLTFTDLLVREGDRWSLYEVKSANDVKPEYAWDVALQVHLLRESGFKLENAFLVHLNREYIRQGELDPPKLFVIVPCLDEIAPLLPEVAGWIDRCIATLDQDEAPEIEIGPHCDDPHPCDFKGHCWAHVPHPSVFNVHYLGKGAFKLYDQGVLRIEDIPDDYPLQKRSRFHVEAHKSGQTIVKPEALREFLGRLKYPLHFLDFETFSTAIPPFDGLGPHAQVPYQYSLHRQTEPVAEPEHSGYLAEAGTDPRAPLLERLLPETTGSGAIVVYNAGFERRILRGLADGFPAHRDEIAAREDRLVDLMEPFRQRHLYLPAMGGSYSLKAVLPALVPELEYAELEISDGTAAMEAYFELAEMVDPKGIQRVREALWDYCRLDTLAMVRIVARLTDYL
jgi:hypothetical protein